MLESASGFDLTPVARLVYELENHDGCRLLDLIQTSLQDWRRIWKYWKCWRD